MSRQTALGLVCAIFLMGAARTAFAVEPDEMLKDPALEARAQTISRGLRCVVCQNQNIDDSGAPLASDMRRLVRERLQAGDSDDQVRAYFVARYGNFVLMNPPFQPDTWALWTGPLAVLALSGGGFLIYLRGKARSAALGVPASPLSEEERALVKGLMGQATTEERRS